MTRDGRGVSPDAKAVLIVYADSLAGGNGRYIHGLVQGLAERTRVHCVCPLVLDSVHLLDLQRLLGSYGAETSVLARSTFFSSGAMRSLVRPWRFAWWYKRQRSVDHVVVGMCNHVEAALLGYVLRIRRPQHGATLVVHDPVPHRWFLPSRLRHLEQRVVRSSWMSYDWLLVHTKAGADVLRTANVPPARVLLSPHPIFEPPTTAVERAERKGICMVGTLRPDKDYVAAVRAYQSLPATVREANPLRIAGRPQRDFDLEGLATAIADDPLGIELEPATISRADFEAILSGSSLCLLPYSRATSGSGVAAEAISLGCPVMTTDDGALAELVAAGLAEAWPATERERSDALLRSLREHVDGWQSRFPASSPTFSDMGELITQAVLGDV